MRILLLAVGLAGCGAPDVKLIVPAGKTAADVQRDNAECKYEAVRAAPENSRGESWQIMSARNEMENMCAKARGYQFVPHVSGEPYIVYR